MLRKREVRLLDDVDFDDGYREPPAETPVEPKSSDFGNFMRRVVASVGPIKFLLITIFYVGAVILSATLNSVVAAERWNDAARHAVRSTPGYDAETTAHKKRENVEASPIMMVIFLHVAWGTVGCAVSLRMHANRYEIALPKNDSEVTLCIEFIAWAYILIWSIMSTVIFGTLFSDTRCHPERPRATCIWDREDWISETLVVSVVILIACALVPIGMGLSFAHEKLVKWVNEDDDEEREERDACEEREESKA